MPLYRKGLFIRRAYGSGKRRYQLMTSRLIANRRYRKNRKMMSRRRHKPELKFFIRNLEEEIGGAGAQARLTLRVTPQAIAQGPAEGQRIGNSLKFLRHKMHMSFRSGPPTNVTTSPSSLYRIVAWSPRVDIDSAQLYMAAIDFQEPIDFNVATVYMDKYINLGNVGAVLTNPDPVTSPIIPLLIFSPPNPTVKHMKKVFKFPRSVKFPPGVNELDEEKYSMYFTIFNPTVNIPLFFFSTCRTTYIDN